jgi:drug/metabolite transporter (DMT)-like permease
MESVYDWVTVAIFAGLVVLFVQRSTAVEEHPREHDSLLLYLGAALGCAVANYVGNKGIKSDSSGMQLLAVSLIAATILFIVYYLRPFKFWPRT